MLLMNMINCYHDARFDVIYEYPMLIDIVFLTLLLHLTSLLFQKKSELKLMEIDAEQLAIPDTEYKCTIKMPSEEFQRIIRDLQVLGDTCTMSCTKEGIRFSVSGNIGTGNILVRSNATAAETKDQVVIDMQEPVELNFALRYLNFFTKATAVSDQVIICMSPEVPMVVEYPIDDMGHVKFYLAPKIDDEENDNE
jgi:proliferating cell nuclear antigen